MSRAKTVASVLAAIVVTAAVTTLLVIPILYAHLRGEYRETVTITERLTMTGTPETHVMWPVPMGTVTYTWTDLTATETYRFCETKITVTLPDRIIEYYVTCVLYPETVTVTRLIEGPGHVQLTTTTTTVFVNRTETVTTRVTQR